jgi:hypothetical protein
MNGYQLHADSYKKLLENSASLDNEGREAIKKKIKALEIMANTDRQTQYELFNSGAFNDVCKGYLLMALDRAGTDSETTSGVLSALHSLFDEIGAEQAAGYYTEH